MSCIVGGRKIWQNITKLHAYSFPFDLVILLLGTYFKGTVGKKWEEKYIILIYGNIHVYYIEYKIAY